MGQKFRKEELTISKSTRPAELVNPKIVNRVMQARLRIALSSPTGSWFEDQRSGLWRLGHCSLIPTLSQVGRRR